MTEDELNARCDALVRLLHQHRIPVHRDSPCSSGSLHESEAAGRNVPSVAVAGGSSAEEEEREEEEEEAVFTRGSISKEEDLGRDRAEKCTEPREEEGRLGRLDQVVRQVSHEGGGGRHSCLVLMGGLCRIEAPYTLNSCFSSNALVLERVTALLQELDLLV